MKINGPLELIATGRLRSYGAALNTVGNKVRHNTDCWQNKGAENSHPRFSRRERAVLRFSQMRCLQRFVAVHYAVYKNVTTSERSTGEAIPS